CALLNNADMWTGTASQLLDALGGMAPHRVVESKMWPATARALSGRLRRAATSLRKVGIEIDFRREGQLRTRTISITRTHLSTATKIQGAQPSLPSVPSASTPQSSLANCFARLDPQTVAKNGSSEPVPTDRANALAFDEKTAADGMDAKRQTGSRTLGTG